MNVKNIFISNNKYNYHALISFTRGLRISTFTSEFKMRVPRAMELLHHIPHIIPHSKVCL